MMDECSAIFPVPFLVYGREKRELTTNPVTSAIAIAGAIRKVQDLGGKAGDAFGEFSCATSDWFSPGDIEEIAAELPKNTSYGMLVFENTWAVPLKKVCLNVGVELVDQDRILPEAIRRLEAIRKVEQDLISQGDV